MKVFLLALAAPYLLIITSPSGQTTTVPYGSLARCQHARSVVEAEGRREIERLRRNDTPSLRMVVPPRTSTAYCLPR